MMSRIERLCVEKGLKMTGQRRVIASVLSDAADHPDVEELYRRAVALDNRMSIATVYRTVRLFEENGILERRDFGGGRARYEPTTPGPHHHLVDVDTGRVIEFIDPELEAAIRTIAGKLGFDLASHRLELFGRRRQEQTTGPEAKAAAPLRGAGRKAAREPKRENGREPEDDHGHGHGHGHDSERETGAARTLHEHADQGHADHGH